MAGPARYSALIDACALHPFAVADALMSVYRERLCQIKWTRHIEEEWLRSVTRDRPELGKRLPHRRDMMRLAVTDWEVPADAYEPLMPALRLPDPNDVHVLAAAIAGQPAPTAHAAPDHATARHHRPESSAKPPAPPPPGLPTAPAQPAAVVP